MRLPRQIVNHLEVQIVKLRRIRKTGIIWVKVKVKQTLFREVSGNRYRKMRKMRGVPRQKRFNLVIKKLETIHQKIQTNRSVLMKKKQTITNYRYKKSRIQRIHTMLGKSWDLGDLVLLKKQPKRKMTRFASLKVFQRKLLKRNRRLQSSMKKNRKC